MKKQIIILLIGLAVIVNAQVAIPPSFGTGTESDPYQIATLENLYWITADSLNWDKHYIQTADIDASETNTWFSGAGWKPIGLDYSNCFSGTYDGRNKLINGLYIYRPTEELIGLFGHLESSEMKDIYLTNIDITGLSLVGGIAGSCTFTNFISCEVSGNINALYNQAGGLVGDAAGSALSKCHNSASVTGENNVGGLIGSDNCVSITSSYNTGNITGMYAVGGLTGSQSGLGIEYRIYNSFNIGVIKGEAAIGGLFGSCLDTEVYHCFSTGIVQGDSLVGGLIGDCWYPEVVYNSFWDTETSGCDSSAGGTGLTTTLMKTTSTYINAEWDFVGETTNGTEDIWDMDGIRNNGYPYLRWMYEPVAIAPALGSGTSEDPYQIANLENLYWITADTLNFDKHYIQIADINAAETRNWFIGDHDDDPLTPEEPMGWKPIGNFSDSEFLGVFTGVYDGQGYTIDNLYINILPKTQNKALTGLFGWAQNAELKNIGIINGTITGGSAVGLLAGSFYGSTVINCYSTGVVTGGWSLGGLPFFDIGAVGGLIGFGGGNIEKCWSNVNVIGYGCTGGLIGRSSIGVISQCYSNGDVTINGDAPEGYGGLVGYCEGDIDNCYTSSNVIGDAAAGFVGVQYDGIITNSFSCGELNGEYCHGFVGYRNIVENCFWDLYTSGIPDSMNFVDPIGITTAQMKSHSTFTDAGWDFVDESTNGTEEIWAMDGVTNNGYPFLSWMSTTDIEENNNLQPVEFTLSQNYPNPFNPVTTIKFSIPSDQNVKLSVFNSNGQLVNELINKRLNAGNYSVQFNAEKFNSGIYFYRLESEKKSIVNKMLLIK